MHIQYTFKPPSPSLPQRQATQNIINTNVNIHQHQHTQYVKPHRKYIRLIFSSFCFWVFGKKKCLFFMIVFGYRNIVQKQYSYNYNPYNVRHQMCGSQMKRNKRPVAHLKYPKWKVKENAAFDLNQMQTVLLGYCCCCCCCK